MARTRLLTLDDAPRLAALLRENREFLAPWDALRPESYFTIEGQAEVVSSLLEEHDQGRVEPHVILDDAGEIVGRITLNSIVRGAFQSCSVGYWVSAEAGGRGLATGAVAALVRHAFDQLDLHRVEAGTLLHNVRSQRVLENNGFTRFGVAPAYLNIAGRWQDHALYQRVRPARDLRRPGAPGAEPVAAAD